VHDVEDAEEAFGKNPDLALVDMDDPEGDGLATLRLAKTAVGKALPVIVVSRDEDRRMRAAELGADEVLPNPPLLPDLQAAVMRATAKPMRVS
jgi:DNA-binding response OmpR family regulator